MLQNSVAQRVVGLVSYQKPNNSQPGKPFE